MVFSLTFVATFIEQGLTPGENWSITLNGTARGARAAVSTSSGFSMTLYSTSTTIVIRIPKGTYSYYVHQPVGYRVSPTGET